MGDLLKKFEKSQRWLNDYYDYDKNSLAVICSRNGRGIILHYVGVYIAHEIEEVCLHFLGDLGLDNAPDGISIWEGKYVWQPGSWEHPSDGDYLPQGKFRQPTEQEWFAIKENRCPWDKKEWLLKEEEC